MLRNTFNMLRLLTGNQSSVPDKNKLAENTHRVHVVLPPPHFFGPIELHYFNNNTVIEIQMRKQ